MDHEYFSIQDAADRFGVDYKTIYRLVRAGEIRAGKVGGMYRIPRAELDAYFQAQMAQTASRGAKDEKAAVSEIGKCGYCLRLISTPEELGGRCAVSECNAPICRECWDKGIRYCMAHIPGKDEYLEQAQQALARGDISCLVTSLSARQTERAWIARYDERVRGIGSIFHPGTREVLRISDWMQYHFTEDATFDLMRLLNVGFLDRTVQATMPHNELSRYFINVGALGRGKPSQAFALEARCVGHLEAYVQHGFDTEPVTPDALALLLSDLEKWSDDAATTYIVGLGSFTGWQEGAMTHIVSQDGHAYRHPRVLPCLIDLRTGAVHYNQADERLQGLGFAELFKLPLAAEEVANIREQVVKVMLSHAGLSLANLVHMLGQPETLVKRACEQLADTGRFKMVQDDDLGLVLLRQHD